MRTLSALYYQRGDRVIVRDRESGIWTPGRVIGRKGRWLIRIATNIPHERNIRWRKLPIGTPIYDEVRADQLRLEAHDPDWDPYSVVPFLIPSEYKVLGGWPGWRGVALPGALHVGAYIPVTSYSVNDPIWAWDDHGWRMASVINRDKSWVAARFLRGYRSQNGRTSRSYRAWQVWPALCDHPNAVHQIRLDRRWHLNADPSTSAGVIRGAVRLMGDGPHLD